MSKIQDLIDEREELKKRSSRLNGMCIRVRVNDRPTFRGVGWFDLTDYTLSPQETSVFYDFICDEKHKADTRILEITETLNGLDKEL